MFVFRKIWRALFCLNSKTLCICQFSQSSSPQLFWNIGISEQKTILQTNEQLMQSRYLLLWKEIFLVYSFSGQVVKWNSPESTWLMQLLVYLRIIEINIKLWTKTCLKWHDDIWTNSLCCNNLLWTSYCFLQFNQQKVLVWFLLRMCK